MAQKEDILKEYIFENPKNVAGSGGRIYFNSRYLKILKTWQVQGDVFILIQG
jgi:hypothetical protein